MDANHKYVEDFLTELHQRKDVFETSRDVKEEESLQVTIFIALNNNSDKTID